MADPTDAGAATAQESTTQDPPADAGNGDGDLSPDARKVVEGADKPDEVRALISAANRRARQAEGELRQVRQELQQHQDAGKSEVEKATARAERAEARVAELERAQLVTSVASRHGIPAEQAHRLIGDTEDELEADAKALAKLLRPVEEPPPDLGSGVRAGAATATGSAAFSEQIRRRAQRGR